MACTALVVGNILVTIAAFGVVPLEQLAQSSAPLSVAATLIFVWVKWRARLEPSPRSD